MVGAMSLSTKPICPTAPAGTFAQIVDTPSESIDPRSGRAKLVAHVAAFV